MKTLYIVLATVLIADLMSACGGSGAGNNTSNMRTDEMSERANHDMSSMSNHEMTKMGEMRSAPDADKQPYDLQFIDTMVIHHEGALKMAEIVLGKTRRTDLKSFAEKVINDQRQEIVQLKQWRDEGYGAKPSALNLDMPGMMNQGMKTMNSEHIKSMDDMEPAHFDRHFLSMMVPHHQGAIEMANEALKKAEHKEIKDLAKKIISTQSSGIKRMENWKVSWDIDR